MGIKKYWWVAMLFVLIVFGILGARENGVSKIISAPAKKITSVDISRRADDLPPPITRKRNERVVVNLETQEVVAEIMPGVTNEYWTYNGQVPGPMIRVKEGDTVEVHLKHSHEGHDHAALPKDFLIAPAYAHGGEDDGHMEGIGAVTNGAHMPVANGNEGDAEHEKAGHGTHSIDLHAVLGPGGGATLTQVKPSEEKVFEFKALRPGLYVYHCASPHIPTHIANGMYGMILVEPKEGLTKVDHEYYVMQGEIYTKGVFGEKGHQEFSKEKLDAEHPEYVVFNGRVGALTGDQALKSNVGETMRIFFGVGTFLPSNFHVIGGIMDKLYPEGDILSAPHRNVQTTLVPAGGAIMTEFETLVPGKLLLVDHALPRAIDKGAVGELMVAGEGRPEIFNAL